MKQNKNDKIVRGGGNCAIAELSNCGIAKFRFIALVAAAFCMANLPSFADTYAYKVQYLQSSGEQYIDTGVVPDANTTFKGRYMYLATCKAGKAYDMIAGCTAPRYYPVSINYSSDPRYERYVYGTGMQEVSHAGLTSHDVIFNDASHDVYVDGKLVGRLTEELVNTKRNCFLFASNNNGKPDYYSSARIYGCEFVNSATGKTLRRFVPVVDDDGRPAMFDEIDEKLYYNLGSGDDFIAGPREGAEDPLWYFVEYLEADGNQWIDTGRFAASNTQTHVGYKFTAGKQVSYAMIGGSQSPKYYPVSLTGIDGKSERYCYVNNPDFATTYPVLQRHETVFNDTGRNVFIDGLWRGAIAKDFGDSGKYTMLMFAANTSSGNANYKSKSRIWHYEIYENDDLQCAFLPAVALGEGGGYEACMHERVSGTNHFNKGTGTFAAGRIVSREVPLRLASRGIVPADGLNVLPFSTRPSYGTVFTVDAEYADAFDAAVRSDGVYLVAKGTGGDEAAVIEVSGDTAQQFPAGAMPACASIVLSGDIRLTEDCDWRGLGKIVVPRNVTIDLGGHDLQVAGFIELPDSGMTITDSATNGGGLCVTVDENDVFVNNCVWLAGSLKLVKRGAGTFVAQLPNQTYSGGTYIEGGVLRMGDRNLSYTYNQELGLATSDVFIGEDATIDTLGVTGHEFFYVVSNGTLSTSRAMKNAHRQIADTFTLAGNATMSGKSFALMVGGYAPATINMNGYTMTVDIETNTDFDICNANFTGEGVIEILSGWLRTYDTPSVGTNLTISIPTVHGGLYIDKDFTVSNLVTHCNSAQNGGDSSKLTILGAFTPAEAGRTTFPNILLADGSTLDLSQMGDMPTFTTSCKAGSHTRTVSFEDGTIKVNLGSRKISGGVPVVAWSEPPSNLGNLKFVAADDNAGGSFVKRSDGLYYTRGLTIVVR